MRGRTGGSVWGVAAFAVALFVIAVLVANMFGTPELVGATTAAAN